jgi:mRNA interferase YafQ
MYFVFRSKAFNASLARLMQNRLSVQLQKKLELAIDMLARGAKLPPPFRDHALGGEYEGARECHIGGDVLLLYTRNKNELILVLVDIGSHAYFFE